MRTVFSSAMAVALVLAAPLARAADGPIRIGVLNDQSGLYSEFGGVGSVEAAKMAAADFGGTVLGRKIEILSADHQNKTDNALSITRKWFDCVMADPHSDRGCRRRILPCSRGGRRASSCERPGVPIGML